MVQFSTARTYAEFSNFVFSLIRCSFVRTKHREPQLNTSNEMMYVIKIINFSPKPAFCSSDTLPDVGSLNNRSNSYHFPKAAHQIQRGGRRGPIINQTTLRCGAEVRDKDLDPKSRQTKHLIYYKKFYYFKSLFETVTVWDLTCPNVLLCLLRHFSKRKNDIVSILLYVIRQMGKEELIAWILTSWSASVLSREVVNTYFLLSS